MSTPQISWSPSNDDIEKLNLTALLREPGFNNYEELHHWSVEKPEAFWGETIQKLGITFKKSYSTLLDTSDGVSKAKWLVGAEFNIAESCFKAPADKTAIITKRYDGRSESITYGELEALSNQVAGGLTKLGLKKGDAVAIDMAMTAEAVAIYLGTLKAGMAVVSIPDSFPEEEIAKRLRIGEAKAIFTQDVMPRGEKKLPMYDKVKATAGDLPVIILPASGELQISLQEHDLSWADFLAESTTFETVMCGPDDIINIIFSSGTTGDPKAIPWMHHTPIKCGSDAMYHQNIRENDVVCWPTSLGWMMGPWLIFATYLNNATMALYEGGPVERGFCEFVSEAKVSMLGLVPSIAKGWRASGCADGIDFSCIMRYSSSGEASNADDYAWLMQLGQKNGRIVPVIEYCGGTEVGGAYISNQMLDAITPATFNGKTLGMDFVLLDEEGQKTKAGEAGEIFLIPPSIGLSTRILNRDNEEVYYADCPSMDSKKLRRHGDRIIKLENGNYMSDGRADNAMNLGGIKIGSAEIERVVTDIDGVVETAAIGIPPHGGGPDQLVIYVVGNKNVPNAQELKTKMQSLIKTRLNPLFRLHDVVMIDALPRTASNKVMHRELRKAYQENEKAA